MKFLYLPLLLLLFVVSVPSQITSSSVNGDIQVIEQQWRVEKHNPMLDRNPLQIAEELSETEATRKQNVKQSVKSNQPYIPPDPKGDPFAEPESESFEISVKYVYEVRLKNTSKKAIQSLTWDYIFADSNTGNELGRRRFTTNMKIASGDTRKISVRAPFPPTGTVNAKTAGKKSREQYLEKIVVQEVKYNDGSKWIALKHI